MTKSCTNSGYDLSEPVGIDAEVTVEGRTEKLTFSNHAYDTLGRLARHVVNGLVAPEHFVPLESDGKQIYQIVRWDRESCNLKLRLKVPFHPEI